MKSWTLEVKEIDGEHILEFTDEILAEAGWKEGDVIRWIDNHNGSWTLRKEDSMSSLKGTKTAECLKEAFAGESMANRRYLYFANQCDISGENDLAALFRSTAEGETGHAHGHMEYLIEGGAGEPGTDMPAKNARQMLEAAIAGETHEYSDMYPGMAKTAREEGFDEVADWFETLAKAERSHANRYAKALEKHLTENS
jgi:rubrerythrin